MKNYVHYVIKLEQPVKMGTQGNQANTEALTYIAGSSIRGALINEALHRYYPNGYNETDTEARSFLFKDTFFSDALLYVNGKDLIPVPFIYYADKHKVRAALKNGEPVEINCREVNKPEEGELRMDAGRYATIADRTLKVASTKRCANLHIAVKKENSDSQLFRYEAITAGQMFSGIIRCKDESDAGKYADILKDKVLYLGGSKGSGYGRVLVSEVTCEDYEMICRRMGLDTSNEEGILTVYFLSNAIILDQNGAVTYKIPEEILERHLGIENVEFIKSYTAVVRTAGFNHKWGSGNVQETAVGAGSYMRYRYTGSLNPGRLKELEERGVGIRKQEGFGRIRLNVNLQVNSREELRTQESFDDVTELSEEEKKQLIEINREINLNRIHSAILLEAVKSAEFFAKRNGKAGIPMTQLMKAYSAVNVINMRDRSRETAAKEDFQKFINSLKKENDQGMMIYKNINNGFSEVKFRIKEKDHYTLDALFNGILNDNVSYTDYFEAEIVGKNLPSECTNLMMKLWFLEDFLYYVTREAGNK